MAGKTRIYRQIGVTALRDPVTREPLPAVPLYIEVTEETKEWPERCRINVGPLAIEMARPQRETA